MSAADRDPRHYRAFALRAIPVAALVAVRLWFEAGPVQAGLGVVAVMALPFVVLPLARRHDARRTNTAGTLLTTGASLLLRELERYPLLAPPLAPGARRRLRLLLGGEIGGTVSVTAGGIRWRRGRLCPRVPDLVVHWRDVASVAVAPHPRPLGALVVFGLRSGERLPMVVRDDGGVIEALTATPADPPAVAGASGWAAPVPKAPRAGVRLPRADCALFAAVWVAAVAYQLIWCETNNEPGTVQLLLGFTYLVALAALGWTLARRSPRAAGWAWVAAVAGTLASALDIPAAPAVAQRELLAHAVLLAVTASFTARWRPLRHPAG
ncbi:MAG TPA: hypothetical protein VFJ85_17550 [Acidimicrobiales bacterium]|nr:hypothetical protein [Acidimicrobiales bacterium]